VYRTSKETQQRKDAKRQHILDTAANVFARRGYHHTTVKEIVEEAGISVGSFYFYFKSKEELFTELYLGIVQAFNDTAQRVLDVQNYSVAKNYTRVITAILWMYQQNRAMAKIVMIESFGVNPEFEKVRWASIRESWQAMEGRLKRIKALYPVHIPDERVAALAFEGSFSYLLMDWLQGDGDVPLTDAAYPLAIYNLQALKIPFEEEDIQSYVREVLAELNQPHQP